MYPFNLDPFALEDAFLFQNVVEPTLPSLPPHSTTGDFVHTFPCDPLMHVPSTQVAKQNALPSLQNAPGAPSIRPQATAMPPADGVRNRISTGVKPSLTSVAVPATPPVRFTQHLPLKILSFRNYIAGLIFTLDCNFPDRLDQDTTEDI